MRGFVVNTEKMFITSYLSAASVFSLCERYAEPLGWSPSLSNSEPKIESEPQELLY